MSQVSLPASIRAAEAPFVEYRLSQVAKLVRQALKEALPDHKFSVRSKSYSGGSSIDVSWIDGPALAQVEPFVRVFSGAGFDGMQDLKYYKRKSLGGTPCSFGVDFIMCHREISRDRVAEVEALLLAAGKDLWLSVVCGLGLDDSACGLVQHARGDARYLADAILRNAPVEKFKDRSSALAASVMLIDEGNE